MQFVNLGETGLRVSRVCVGCMSYGKPEGRWKWTIPEDKALPLLNYCYEKNLNFYDTANIYSNGVSEEILGKAIKKYNWRRENIVVATKCFAPVGRGTDDIMAMTPEDRENNGYANSFGLSRKHIFDAVDASLKRLDLEYVDLLQIHRFDYKTPIKETMKALHDVVQSGKVRYIGASSMWAHQLLGKSPNRYSRDVARNNFMLTDFYRNAIYCPHQRVDRVYHYAKLAQCSLPGRGKGDVPGMCQIWHGPNPLEPGGNGFLNEACGGFQRYD